MGNKFSFVRLGQIIERSSMAAANRAAQTTITRASSFIRDKYNIKKSELDKGFRIENKAKAETPWVLVRVRKKEFPLMDFSAKQIGKSGRPKLIYTKRGKLSKKSGPRKNQGVKATVVRGDRRLYRSSDNTRGSFVAVVGKGQHKGVFIRTERMNSKGKQVIEELFGMSLTRITMPKTGHSKVLDEMQKTFTQEYKKRLKTELEYRKPQS